ncbi:MAG: hypothetical protein KJ914_03005 [Gammaproteobacteria bacterium]|nr:hypothetical protein [Gammaproteobacteria bacterium]MBU1725654.1 hypothetical protein [Gammaproteobacteria bacterium]MBU2003994.1 hypothetical protein [Gammaproteobacteria bacterium]
MTEMLTLLVLAYIFLLAMLVLVITHGRLHWLFKLGLVALAGGFYLISYQGWKQVQGWPSRVELPDKFLLHASVIEEPDQEKGTQGRIFVWASNLQGSKPADEPRAYEIAYEREVHSALEDALRNQRNGNVQIGTKGGNKAARDGAPVSVRQLGEVQDKLKFSNLPDPALPEK